MPKIFEYFGFIFYFYSNVHEPIHVHVMHGARNRASVVRISRKNWSVPSGKPVNMVAPPKLQFHYIQTPFFLQCIFLRPPCFSRFMRSHSQEQYRPPQLLPDFVQQEKAIHQDDFFPVIISLSHGQVCFLSVRSFCRPAVKNRSTGFYSLLQGCARRSHEQL